MPKGKTMLRLSELEQEVQDIYAKLVDKLQELEKGNQCNPPVSIAHQAGKAHGMLETIKMRLEKYVDD